MALALECQSVKRLDEKRSGSLIPAAPLSLMGPSSDLYLLTLVLNRPFPWLHARPFLPKSNTKNEKPYTGQR